MARKTVRQVAISVNTLFGSVETWPPHEPVQPAWKGLPGAASTCSKCKVSKSVTQFSKDASTKSGLNLQCKECRNFGKSLRWRTDAKMREEVSNKHRLRRYGVDAQTLAQMMAAQDGKCSACKDPLQPGRETHVDHCHTTGKVRELLCRACNHAVGHLEKNPARLPGIAAYLARHRL